MNHILLGPEEGLKADWLAEERKRILSQHPDAEMHQIFVGDDKGEDLEAILSQSTLFSSFRFVAIKQYELRSAKDTFDKAIIDFLASGQDDAEFVILSTEKSKSRINAKIANDRNVSIQTFWEMFDNQKRDWIRRAFQKEGFSIGDEAIAEVLFSVDNNTADMKNLVESLAIFFHATEKDKREISAEDIARYALQTRGEDGATLFSAIADGDLEHAEMIASSIISSDSQAPLKAFATIVSRFRQLESFEELRARGFSEKEAFDNADSLSPYPVFYPTKGIKGRDQQAFRKAAMRYPLKDTRRIIGYLTKMDTEMKSAGPDWMRIMMSELIAGIMLHKGADTDLSLESFPLDGSL